MLEKSVLAYLGVPKEECIGRLAKMSIRIVCMLIKVGFMRGQYVGLPRAALGECVDLSKCA